MGDLVVLLPVRNGGEDLPRWLDAVARYADAVIALDDGSNDDTRSLLEASPIVHAVLTNPVRESYEGWDDAANRQRLLDAVGDVRQERDDTWVLQLDADERLAPGDAEALRAAVDADALDPTHGYLLRVLRVIEEEGLAGYDEDHLWVGRLFRWRAGQRLPGHALHLVPMPDDIPESRWTRTTLRILHDGSRDAARREARLSKYREADPSHEWQSDYTALLSGPKVVRPVDERPPCLPVVPNTPWPREADELNAHPNEEPLLSVVVIARNDEAVIRRALDGVLAQRVDASVQVISAVSGDDGTADIIRSEYPMVELVTLDGIALPGRARNAGLRLARGRYVTFPGSHIELPPGSLQARLDAHRAGWGMVTCTTVNGTRTPAGWASYFVDHAGGLPGRPSHAMTVAPSYASYLTEAVRYVGMFPEDMRTAEDTIVNTRLFELGYGAWRAQHSQMVHHSPCRSTRVLIAHHHRRGRGLGQMIRDRRAPDAPLLTRHRLATLGLRYIPGRVHRIHHYTWRYGENLRPKWLTVSPLATLAVVSAWAGAWRELLAPRRGWWHEVFADQLTIAALRSRWRASRAR